MTGFHYYARVLRDPARPFGRRYLALRQAASSYAWLRHQSFTAVWTALGARVGFDDGPGRPSEAQLLAALAVLEAERRAFLPRLAAMTATRRQEKRLGQRHLRRGQFDALFPPRDRAVEFTVAAGKALADG